MNVFQLKQQLRNDIKSVRAKLAPQEVTELSTRVLSHLEKIPAFKAAKTVHSYVAWHKEVETYSLIDCLLQKGVKVVVPLVEPQRLTLRHIAIKSLSELGRGYLGIPEPSASCDNEVAIDEFDIVLVPGVAFDRAGNRLGYGGGYYDRFLMQVRKPKIGLAFDLQLVDRLPTRADDEPVDIIVTESGCLEVCRK